MNSGSLFQKIMQPGAGVMLLPFVRVVISLLLLLTVTAAILGVARIHMVILSFLASGLLSSLYFFEQEYKRMKGVGSRGTGGNGGTEKKVAKVAKSD